MSLETNMQDMSSNIAALNQQNNMENLTNTIENELEGNQNQVYIDQNQLQQLQQLQQLHQMQLQQQLQQQVQQNGMDITMPADVNQLPENMQNVKKEEPKKRMLQDVTQLLKEPVLLLVLFMFISHPSVATSLSSYIPQFATNEDGTVTMTSIALKAVVLVGVYTLVKKFAL